MSDITLYSYYRSSCSYRVRIVLNLKKLDYKYRAVHLVRDGGEQHRDSYRQLNRMGQVPTLVHEGKTICQSMAIIEYLDAVWPEPRLFPRDPYKAALVRELCEDINAGIQPIQNLSVLQALGERFGADDQACSDWCAHWINQGFEALEARVQHSAGAYCMGDAVTAVDAFLVPQIYNAQRFRVDMSRFPTLKRVHGHCINLPEFVKAHPSCQPDTPPDA